MEWKWIWFIKSKDGYIATNNHVVTSEKYTVKNLGVEFNYKDEIKLSKLRLSKVIKLMIWQL